MKFFKKIIKKNKILLAKDWIMKYLNILFEEKLVFINIIGINLIMLISNEHHKKNQFHLDIEMIVDKMSINRNVRFIQLKIYKG